MAPEAERCCATTWPAVITTIDSWLAPKTPRPTCSPAGHALTSLSTSAITSSPFHLFAGPMRLTCRGFKYSVRFGHKNLLLNHFHNLRSSPSSGGQTDASVPVRLEYKQYFPPLICDFGGFASGRTVRSHLSPQPSFR